MGNPVPPDEPEIDPAKTYSVTVNACAGPQPPWSCCVPGNEVQDWLDGDGDCVPFASLCGTLEVGEMLLDVVGPFDIFEDCVAYNLGL